MLRKLKRFWNRPERLSSKARRKSAGRKWRNNLNRTVELGLESLEPRWVLAAGMLDSTFNPGGTPPGVLDSDLTGGLGVDDGQAVAMQTIAGNTKILVAGIIQTTGSALQQNFGVARYNLDGTLDTSFGVSGLATIDFALSQDNAFDMVVDSLGRIIVVGSASIPTSAIGVARLTVNGALDNSFSGDGKATAEPAGVGGTYTPRGVALQSDGKIVVVGTRQAVGLNTQNFLTVRFEDDGDLDTTFNGTGAVQTDFSSGTGRDNAFAVAIQSDGKIIVGGSAQPGGTGLPVGFGLVRYETNGTLDTTFDGDGKVFTDITGPGANNDTINAIVIQSDGRIVVAGQTAAVDLSDAVMARYTDTGALDTATFNSAGPQAGVLRVHITSREQLEGLVMQPDGKFVASGFATTQIGFSPNPVINDDQLLVMRVLSSGVLDTTFNGSGMNVLNRSVGTNTLERFMDVALQPDGKIVAAGRNANDFVVARYDSGLVVRTISGPAAVDEGATYTLTLNDADPTVTSWTINWGDSVEVVPGNPTSANHVYADGLANYTISASVTNSAGPGQPAGNTVAVTVDNVAPTLTISGAASLDEAAVYTLNLSSSDPGTDTITSWTINWGDATEVVSGNPASVDHTYADGDAN
ncbi:MAG: hypothetical protein WD669_06610, partial [Pirellulales bacterium]